MKKVFCFINQIESVFRILYSKKKLTILHFLKKINNFLGISKSTALSVFNLYNIKYLTNITESLFMKNVVLISKTEVYVATGYSLRSIIWKYIIFVIKKFSKIRIWGICTSNTKCICNLKDYRVL